MVLNYSIKLIITLNNHKTFNIRRYSGIHQNFDKNSRPLTKNSKVVTKDKHVNTSINPDHWYMTKSKSCTYEKMIRILSLLK